MPWLKLFCQLKQLFKSKIAASCSLAKGGRVEKLLRYLNSHADDYIQFKLTRNSRSINLFNLATLIRL